MLLNTKVHGKILHFMRLNSDKFIVPEHNQRCVIEVNTLFHDYYMFMYELYLLSISLQELT